MIINDIKTQIKKDLYEHFNVEFITNEPKDLKLGDISLVLFQPAKSLNLNVNVLKDQVVDFLKKYDFILDTKFINGFLNIYLNRSHISSLIIDKTIKEDDKYPYFNKVNETICVDYSSPNIAKSFSIGHLRSTIIGNSLIQIAKKLGYNTIGINYLGDWGTQFGKMIVAYNKWLDKKALEENPILELTRLYVKFHDEALLDPKLEDEARLAFLKCEQNDENYLKLWQTIRELSLKESKEIYDLLDISFDSYKGEAYYNDKMHTIINNLKEKNLLVKDNGAMVVRLDDMPPALIQRSDGGTLYITRDLTAFFDRLKEYKFKKMLYVVGNEQKLHFNQLKEVLKQMNIEEYKAIEHVNFGLYLTNGKKMSTRKGGVVKLYDVLINAINLAKEEIIKKNPNLENKDEIAKYVGISAILFNDLKNNRELNIEFDLNNSVSFEGNTGPYLLYSVVRIKSILEQVTLSNDSYNKDVLNKDEYYQILKLVDMYDEVIIKSFKEYEPSIIAKYLLNVAQAFNQFYASTRIITNNNLILNTNILVIKAVKHVLTDGLSLLGIKTVSKM